MGADGTRVVGAQSAPGASGLAGPARTIDLRFGFRGVRDTPLMSEENVEWARKSLEHFASTGTPYLTRVSADVEVYDHDIPDASNPYVGHEGIADWLADFAESWNRYELEVERIVDAGECVVALVRINAEGAASGVELTRGDAIVNTFRDGEVVRLDYFNSHAEGLNAAGVSE
jgi:ketosteroid isomerase-like protein